MYRNITKELEKWASETNRRPLIINGARQIGKSWAVRNLGQTVFNEKYCEINFEKTPEFGKMFEQDLDTKRIISELEIKIGFEITRETLIFFDEIQNCPKAIMSLRYFFEDSPELFIIAAGSLLEFQLKEIPFPVGRVQLMDMHPMNFEEYLIAIDNKPLLKILRNKIQKLPSNVETLIYRELQNYFWVGGMPACVQLFANTKNYLAVRKLQKDLINNFIQDFSKYNPIVNKDCLLEILNYLNFNVGHQIIYTKISQRFTGPTIKKGIAVLSMAKLLYTIDNVSISGLPFMSSGKQFKLVFVDIGLLLSMADIPFETIFNNSNINNIYEGSIAEQYVAQQLISQNKTLKFWSRTQANSNAEVDYVIQEDGKIIPIEVKSGVAGRLKSLHVLFQENKHIDKAIVYSKAQFGNVDKIYFTPIYYVGF